jgi:phage-related protein
LSNLQGVYDPRGSEPVREFIDALDDEVQAAVENQIDRLNLLSDELPHLPFPHSSQVQGELRELRCHYGRQLYRVLYRRSERLLVLLHVFAKRSAKIPERDITIAQECWEDGRGASGAAARGRP